MPFARPTLTELRNMVAQDINGSMPPGVDALLRFSNLGITGKAQAGLGHLHFGYLDWIARQSNPWTSTGEYLRMWAALKDVFQEPATQAAGSVTFSGVAGRSLPAGTPLRRGDGVTYTTTAAGTVSVGGSVTVPAIADADPAGLLGANGNCDAGTVISLATSVDGIQSGGVAATAFTGGADLELEDNFRARMIAAYQHPQQGGADLDYIKWAREVPGVTRAWVAPNAMGAGTVVLYTMLDVSEAAHGGFPQGTDGVSQNDFGPGGVPRATVATGDQLLVADHVKQKQPATALVYSVAPLQDVVNFTIAGLAGASAATKAAVAAAIDGVFLQQGGVAGALNEAGVQAGTVNLSYVESAIAAVPLTEGFVISSPAGNITSPAGHLPVRGTVTFS